MRRRRSRRRSLHVDIRLQPKKRQTIQHNPLFIPTRAAIRSAQFYVGRDARKLTVHQSIIPRKARPTRKGILRLSLHPSECRRRKVYKKTMLRKLAAQHIASGKGSINQWRRQRSARRHITYRC